MKDAIRVVSIVEAWFVTGQAKNLLEFAVRSRNTEPGVRPVEISLSTYERGRGAGEKNQFVIAARERGVRLDLLTEERRFDPSIIAQLDRLLAELKPDIVQTHNVKSHFLMRYSGLSKKYCWLAFHHGYTTPDFKMRLYNALDRWSFRGARHVVTVCGKFRDDVAGFGVPRERITVRHNSVKPFVSPAPEVVESLRRQWPADVPVLVCIGRLSSEKGHADLLRALAILRKEQSFHAVFVGDGPEQARIEALIRELKLEEHVTLAGLQHDVRPYYAAADVVVMPSLTEGSPNVLLEAMSAGVPVVATRVGGIPEIAVDGKTALLVPKSDPKALAAALARMLREPELRSSLAREGQALAVEKYSPEAYCRSMVGIYEQVLRAGN